MRTGRPLGYDPATAWKLCEQCGKRFDRHGCRANMTDDEWRRRRWCSWECRSLAAANNRSCGCCMRRPVNCRGLCDVCYEWMRERDGLEEPARSAWIQYHSVLDALRTFAIPGIGRRNVLRQPRPWLPTAARTHLMREIVLSVELLDQAYETAAPLDDEEIEAQRAILARSATASILAIQGRNSPAYCNARARLIRAWAALQKAERGPLFADLSQN